jgi:hypothetical protein
MSNESDVVFTSGNTEKPKNKNYSDFENSTYDVISKMAYLIGVSKNIFENEHEPPKMEIYQQLEQDKNARIIRNLCLLRTAIEKKYSAISQAMYTDLKNLHTLPKLIPQEAIAQLEQDGISIIKANYKLNLYLMDINKLIQSHINAVKLIFPIWVKWEYLRSIFLMPNGFTENGLKYAAHEYYSNQQYYPYQTYINWPTSPSQGNILYNDKKFISLLYEINEDCFDDFSKVTDAGNITKNGIYQFLESSVGVDIVVDCENSDPYKLYATLNNLDQKALLSKIKKMILYNDVHTTTAWKVLDRFTEIPTEHIMIERVKENKSLVDISLVTGVSREHFAHGVDSFILLSSDSDYWGMITALPEVRFLVMVESDKCGSDIKNALTNWGITYCYIDDFCTGNSGDIKIAALTAEIHRALEQAVHFNIYQILDAAYTATRVSMTEAESRQFYQRYIKPMKLVFDADGEADIELGS